MRTMRGLTRLLGLGLVTGTMLFPTFSHADDLADEADLQFQLAAERYQAKDFRGALEHFMSSNRLVPNKNVLFNIARTYEQLNQTPDAYRYYTLAIEGETNADARKRVEDALVRIRPQVAILNVKTDPPGATVYLDRKDLGGRGATPRALGLGAGKYRVLVDLPGYEPAELGPFDVKLGSETPVEFKLVRIMGTVDIETPRAQDQAVSGVQIHVDSEDAPTSCSAPCQIDLPPGRHTLFAKRDGFSVTETQIEVPPKSTIHVRPKLAALLGNVVVNADVRDALISVDDKPSGFTPSVINVPVGKHVIKIAASGFRTKEYTVDVKQTEQVKLDAELASSEEVTAASRTAESVDDAPASVTIISGQELRAMGYPTIAEAIRGVRGVYLAYDDTYYSAGFRGFSNPGSYGNRILVLLDGQPMNDNYIWSSYLGYDGRADLDDIERIEIVRGAGSVVYGTGAFFGVINLVTRDRNAPTHGEVSISAASNAGRGRATVVWRATPESGLWLSVAGTQGPGTDKYYPELVGQTDRTGGLSDGFVRGADGHASGTISGRAWWKSLTVQWFMNSHKKYSPSSQFGTVVGDTTYNRDTRGMIEARYEPQITKTIQSLSRAHMNYYGYDSEFVYTRYDPTAEDQRNPTSGNYGGAYGSEYDRYRGVWGGLEQRFQIIPNKDIRVLAGLEVIRHFRADQLGQDDRAQPPGDPQYDPNIPNDRRGNILKINTPFSSMAAYVNGDFQIHPKMRLSAGARFDQYIYDKNSAVADPTRTNFLEQFNPRVALIAKPKETEIIKLMLGKAFRVPSVYELFYQSAAQVPPTNLKPEQVLSAELEYTHRFSSTWVGVVSGYLNRVTNLIELNKDLDIQQYQNTSKPVLVYGGELEARREWRQGWMVAANYTLQKAEYLNDPNAREVPNSPRHLGSIKGVVPIVGRALTLGTRLSVIGPSYDLNKRNTALGCDDGNGNLQCAPQGKTDAGAVWDIVLSGEAERLKLRYAVGLYNAMDWKYSTVPSAEYAQRTIRQPGRNVYAQVTMSF